MTRLKGHKYGAVRTTVDGITFDSKREAAQYGVLKLREKVGEIRDLRLQPEFELIAWRAPSRESGQVLGKYRADFAYTEVGYRPILDREVVEDVKGFDTPLSKWKRKHVSAQYGIDVRIVK